MSERKDSMFSDRKRSSSRHRVGDASSVVLPLFPAPSCPGGARASPTGSGVEVRRVRKEEAAQVGLGRKDNCTEIGDTGSPLPVTLDCL